MKDLTQGAIAGHLVAMAIPTAAGMLLQTLCFFVDLYFVAGLGGAAVAGVTAAGNAMRIIFSLTTVLAVGTVTLIAHAVGRKDRHDANLTRDVARDSGRLPRQNTVSVFPDNI